MRIRSIPLIVLALCPAACGTAEDAPSPDSLTTQARRLDLDGEHDAAVTVYRQALEAAPDSFDANYGIARALDLAGSYAEARDHFARAIDLAADNSKDQALRMLGVSWTFVREPDQAAVYFREVFDRRLNADDLAGASDVANELGRVYLELGALDQAETWYRTGYDTASRATDRPAWQVDLADLRWAHAQARLAARRGRAEEAAQHIAAVRTLLDKDGNDDQEVQFPYLVGYVNLHLEDYASARTQLQQADQDDPFVLLLLAQASEGLGNGDEALDYYRRVLSSTSHAVNNAFARPIARQKLDSGR